jgi:glycosyltransferase involved in cell wall biosynthesis
VAGELISIIIPVKNGERFLAEALGDVTAQTYRERETIVVDGRSTDRSVEIARSFAGVRVLTQARTGFADAWNVGLAAATGELVAFLDSDDRWPRDKLAKQVGLLRRRPEVDYVITFMRYFMEPGMPTPPGFRPHLLEGEHVAYMPSALLARRKVFETIGVFPTDYTVANDIEWFARLKDSELVGDVVPEVVVRKRVHDTNLSLFAARDLNRELLRLLRESVARQRRPE